MRNIRQQFRAIGADLRVVMTQVPPPQPVNMDVGATREGDPYFVLWAAANKRQHLRMNVLDVDGPSGHLLVRTRVAGEGDPRLFLCGCNGRRHYVSPVPASAWNVGKAKQWLRQASA